MRRHTTARVTTMLAILATLAGAGGPIAAQDVSLAAETPRFLHAFDRPARIVEIDAARVPLFQRRISIDLDDVTLGYALTTVAQLSGVRLVYSRDVVDLKRKVELHAQAITVAGALSELLLGASVDVMLSRSESVSLVPKKLFVAPGTVSGRVTDARTRAPLAAVRVSLSSNNLTAFTNDSGAFRITNVPPGTYTISFRRIGYGLRTQSVNVVADRDVTVEIALELSALPLDAVVVTGSVSPTEQKSLPNPITVITATDIRDRGVTQINQLFRGEVPGIFAAEMGDAGPNIGAVVYVRGASTLFNMPVLKTYLDGVELANSEFLNEIDPAMIDHIEIIRGPEASTLYGTQAINGVMQVFTKKGALGLSPRVSASLGVGSLEGLYHTGVWNEDNVSVTGGTQDVRYNAGLTYRHDGPWTSGFYLDTYSGYGSLSLQPASSVRVDVMARLGRQESRHSGVQSVARQVLNGTLQYNPDQVVPSSTVSTQPQHTLGVSVHYSPWGTWQHHLTVGLDKGAEGYDYIQYPTFANPGDSLTTVYSYESTRTTAAYNTGFDWTISRLFSANVTAGADWWDYQNDGFDTYATTTTVGSLGTTGSIDLSRQRDHSTGVFGQTQLGIADALFLTAGARMDRGPDLPEDRHHRFVAPRVGASYAFALGGVRGKLRAGYGSALKPADPGYKRHVVFNPTYVQLGAPNLRPERQSGWDGGMELYASDRGSISVTRYDQQARDLIAVAFLSQSPVFTQQFQNVARVRNRGWELEGSLRLVRGLRAKTTYSVVESNVEALAPDDQTGYKVGEPILGIPHHTGALTFMEDLGPLTIETGATFVGTSQNYDWMGFFRRSQVRLGTPNYDFNPVGFPAAYRYALRMSYAITPGLTLFGRSENLANTFVVDQGFFPSDQVGRTIMVGLRVH